jgi:DNA-binding response OmpR family regulator
MTVLIADDDEDQLAIRGALLRHNGFQTVEASNVSAALQLAEAESPSYALIDLCLPTEQDGLYLIREIKHRYPAMPVFVLTGRAVDSTSAPELRSVDGIFVKGSAIREVISRLRDRG